jgi:hypothetical protein
MLPLQRPPLDLALDVTLALGQFTEAHFVDIDGMQIGEHVERDARRGEGAATRDEFCSLRAVEHDAVDEAHHVEGCSVDVDVGAQTEALRNGHVRAADRRDDAVLAGHVVRRRQHLGQSVDDAAPSAAVAVDDCKRQVGASAGDELERVRRCCARDVLIEPCADACDVDPLHGRHRTGD